MSKTKTQASQMVRGAGMAADVWRKLDEAIKARGGSDDDLHRLARPEGDEVIGMVADRLVKVGAVQRNRYPVKASHKSIQDAIAAGKYDYANDYITAEHFKLEGEIVVDTELMLYHPNRSIESDDVIKELDQMGLRAANLQELCAFGEKYPDIQREFPVVALGSVCVFSSGDRYVPFLGYWGAGRGLCLLYWADEWLLSDRFLAARTTSPRLRGAGKPACPAGR